MLTAKEAAPKNEGSTMNERILVPAEEAAKMLSMGRSTFWKAVKEKLLPEPVKIGGLTRWRVSDLERHFQARQTTNEAT